jgi:hypothetical protein
MCAETSLRVSNIFGHQPPDIPGTLPELGRFQVQDEKWLTADQEID